MNRELKRLAQNARNRLINKGENGSKKVATPVSSNIKFKVLTSDADENFNSRARATIENESLSPIKDLMDMAYYQSLSQASQEKYLFDLVEKYNRFRKEFERNAAAL